MDEERKLSKFINEIINLIETGKTEEMLEKISKTENFLGHDKYNLAPVLIHNIDDTTILEKILDILKYDYDEMIGIRLFASVSMKKSKRRWIYDKFHLDITDLYILKQVIDEPEEDDLVFFSSFNEEILEYRYILRCVLKKGSYISKELLFKIFSNHDNDVLFSRLIKYGKKMNAKIREVLIEYLNLDFEIDSGDSSRSSEYSC